MDINIGMSQKMKQIQVLSQQARMGIHILQLPLLELRTYLSQEMVDNPLLEDDFLDDDINSQDDIDMYEQMVNDYSDLPRSTTYDPDQDKKRQFREMSITKEESLEDHLMWQLGMHSAGIEFKIGEFIIGNLDENGYLQVTLESIDNRFEVGPDFVTKVLKLIQSFDPIGVAARDVRESLMIQLRFKGKEDTVSYKIVESYLDELSRKKYTVIARKLAVKIEEVEQAHIDIAALEPKPGRAYSTEQAVKIVPDLILVRTEDGFTIKLNNEYIPSLRINSYYSSLYKQKGVDTGTRRYIKQRRERAKCLISALEQSQDTIRRIASFIVDYQKDFLERGEGNIKPLKLTDVAQVLEVNESTVSRAISNKYMQTDFGVISLKRFFSVGLVQTDGSTMSSESIRATIRELIDNENPQKPLSDQKLVDLLQEKGIKVARRTVTKYRKNMKILSSGLRK